MSATTRLLTAEEFFALPGSRHQELVRGEVVDVMPPGGVHGEIALAVGMVLKLWARQGPGGVVGVESGFIVEEGPDTVRGPDVYYVRPERVPEGGAPEGFWRIAPDLAVEVVSPGDTAEEVEAKVFEYLAAGTAAVWVVYPRSQRVTVHTPDGLARTYGPEATLALPELLPGFSVAVKELFA
ncbi:MAG TPA: Uma2 family endonuclease [Chloroflexaceae bacterium]|nr:Uma2 family endonuclease [Chloroflexaceae bacterium]